VCNTIIDRTIQYFLPTHMCRRPSPARFPARLQQLLSLLFSRACLPCLGSLPPELQRCAAMNVKRDRSDSMAEEPTWHTVEPSSLSDLLEMPSQFQPGSPSCCTCFNIMYFGSLSQQTHIQISHPILNKNLCFITCSRSTRLSRTHGRARSHVQHSQEEIA
jgi:hypothetical protein